MHNTRGTPSRGWALAWLGHPGTVLALILLIVNDHILKTAYPGWVTGKLSDAAGLVLAPPLVALLFARFAPVKAVTAALALTGLAFTLIKSSSYGETVASAAWTLVNGSSVVRADRTDLLTLPFLAVAWWTWRSAGRVRPLRVALVLPIAILGVAATSAPQYPTATSVLVDGDAIVAVVHDAYQHSAERDQWIRSTNGGLTWQKMPADRSLLPRVSGRACIGVICYRVVPGRLRVEQSADGGRTWSTDWQVSDRGRKGMLRTYEAVADPARDLSSVALAVQARPGGGHVVLVADGRDGFAWRDPTGHWKRRGYLAPDTYGSVVANPESFPAGRVSDLVESLLLALVLGFAMVSLGATTAAVRLGRSVVLWLLGTAVLGAPIVLLVLMMLIGPTDSLLMLPLWAITVGSVMVAVPVAITQVVRLAAGDLPGGRWSLEVTAAGLLTATLVAALSFAWVLDLIHQPVTAVGLTLAVSLPGVALASRAARLADPPGLGPA